jgi:large subunit ribosomal protein L22
MGKKPAERVLGENEAKAFASAIRVSPRKLNLVAQMIRGLKADVAVSALTFSSRRVAKDVRKVLQSAIANAENNHQLDVDRLYVAEAFVGKGLVMKRFSARARGRSARIEKPFSNLTVIVRERVESETARKSAGESA